MLDAILAAMPVTAGEARGYLARFLFQGDDVFKEVRLLSGGERSRLELALLGIMPSNLLLLDEPTNHLDIPAREAIEAFLVSTPATILVVSHDRRLLETICDRLWVVDRRAGGPVRRRLPRLAVGHRRRLDAGLGRRGRGAPAPRRPYADRGCSGGGARTEAGRPFRGPHPADAGGLRRSRGRGPRLSKDAYRRQKAAVEAELTRLGLRKSHLELAASDPSVLANFVELRRITSELADVTRRPRGGRRGLARDRGAGPVNRASARPDRADRADRVREVHGRGLARGARRGRHRRGRCRPRGDGAGHARARRGAGPLRRRGPGGRRDAGPGGPGPDRVHGRGRAPGPRGDRPSRSSGRGSWARSRSRGRRARRRSWSSRPSSSSKGGLAELCDEVWWVSCDDQRARLIGRGMDPADADRRIAAQAGLQARVRAGRPDLSELDTSGSLAEAEERVARLWERAISAGNAP